MKKTLPLILGLMLAPALEVVAAPAAATPAAGVLLMAHGGRADWNQAVLDMVAPLQKRAPLEVAFGMATADSIQAAVAALEKRGVRRIVVVRLFVSGDSFLTETEQIVGLRPGAPPRPAGGDAAHAGHAHHGGSGHSMALWKIDARSAFVLTKEGLMESPLVGEILARRARELSKDPARESVLILGHGPADDAENARWLEKMRERAASVRDALPFREVATETLREDWPEKRKAAEESIQSFVRKAREGGGTTIVLPFRVQGFGPYAGILKGLSYVSDGKGFLPDPLIARWIEDQVARAAASLDWENPFLAPSETRAGGQK